MTQQKTYWHLLNKRRIPSEYELVTSKLHYYIGRGFEVDVPLKKWYEQYQTNSPFQARDWDSFQDPRETTYAKYTHMQSIKEQFVDGLLHSIDSSSYDKDLSPKWVETLDLAFAPLLYPWHGMQMVACYIGQMAPSGRITIAAMLQAADEMRRVQRVAYRTCQLQTTHPDFGLQAKSTWQDHPYWQPLRKTIEQLLVTYDWGESFVGLNLVIKPIVDQFFMVHMANLARAHGDFMLAEMLACLNEDCEWHRQWSEALVKLILDDHPEIGQVIQGWINKWYPLAVQSINAFAPLLSEASLDKKTEKFEDINVHVRKFYAWYLESMGLECPHSVSSNKSKT